MSKNEFVKIIIMAVDDDPITLDLISNTLQPFSEITIIHYFENSDEFISKMNHDVDLVILDTKMPNHDIHNVMSKIESINPFVLVTLLVSNENDTDLIETLKLKYNRIRSSINKDLLLDEAKILDKNNPSWLKSLHQSIQDDLELIRLIK